MATTVAFNKEKSSTGALTTLLATNNDAMLTLLRVALGVVMFPHGAQHLLGWFGGPGFSGTMGFMTGEPLNAPGVLAFLAIVAEFFGSIALILGVLGRVASFGILCTMLVAAVTHIPNGFFMNWMGTQAGEGYEYHILAIAMAVAIVIKGSGALSIDRAITTRSPR